ncbi:hypothetical protein Avbf_02608 [Armadillidium vulgare]|nr:hypothetical protein Avbf_02608 [Armadillidium vulgare]
MKQDSKWRLVADSWGKIPDGFFYGNIHIVGMYEECLQIQGSVTPLRDDSKINFQGKYCKIFYESDRENKVGSGPDRKSKVESGPDRKNKVGSGPGIAVLFTPLPFYYATCIPSVCTDEDLMVSLTQTFSEIDRKVVGLDCHEEGRSNHANEETNSAEVDMLLVNEKFQIDLQIC